MTTNTTTPTIDQAVAALATASQALQAAQADFKTKNLVWESALNALGILPTRRFPGSRGQTPLPAPPANADLNALAATLAASKNTLNTAQSTYNSAKAAHNAALASAGVIATVNSNTASTVTSS